MSDLIGWLVEMGQIDGESHVSPASTRRGQSAIIGVALLLTITVVSVGLLTAGTGILVDEAAQEADIERIGEAFTSGYRPATLEGSTTMALSLTGGKLVTAPRAITISRYGDIVTRVQTLALKYERSGRSVTVHGGGVLQDRADGATFIRDPNVITRFGGDGDRVLTIALVVLSGNVDERVEDPRRVRLEFEATHERRALGAGRYTVRVETATPGAWVRYFEEAGAEVRLQEGTDDEVDVVIADLGRVTEARLILHHVEVRSHG